MIKENKKIIKKQTHTHTSILYNNIYKYIKKLYSETMI